MNPTLRNLFNQIQSKKVTKVEDQKPPLEEPILFSFDECSNKSDQYFQALKICSQIPIKATVYIYSNPSGGDILSITRTPKQVKEQALRVRR